MYEVTCCKNVQSPVNSSIIKHYSHQVKHFRPWASREGKETPNSTLVIQPLNSSMEMSLYFTSRSRGRFPPPRALMTFLADGHLLDHVWLARRACYSCRGASTVLLLEDLPELQTLIGSYTRLVRVIGRRWDNLPAVASICPSGLRQL